MDEIGKILVTPEQLQKSAEEWETLFQQAGEAYARIDTMVKSTSNCFRGKTAEVFCAEVVKRTEKGVEKINSMKRFSAKLTEIANSYQKAEGENKDVFARRN